jgi:hypothetical protein
MGGKKKKSIKWLLGKKGLKEIYEIESLISFVLHSR